MIILLTGKPGVGKTTALQKFIKLYTKPSNWIITSRIPNPSGDGGLGFTATNSRAQTQLVSHKTDIHSDIVVGRNHVDVRAVEKMFLPILEDILKQSEKLAIIDEIGPIQMAAPAFEALLPEVLSPQNDLVAIIHQEEARLEHYRQSKHNILLNVTVENREMLPQALLVMTAHRQQFNALDKDQQLAAAALLETYIAGSQLTQVEKLMENAIYYARQGRIQKISEGSWTAKGRHGNYEVTLQGDTYSCTCDLFNGRGEYTNHPGECSHIQTVKITRTIRLAT